MITNRTDVEFRVISHGAFDMSPGFDTQSAFPNTTGKRATLEYWAIFALCYPAFLLVAALKRLLPTSWSTGSYYSACRNGGRRETIHAEAMSQASTAATYAFMG